MEEGIRTLGITVGRRAIDPEEEAALVPIEQHRARILAAVRRLAPVRTATSDALGKALAEMVVSPIDLPPFRSSAMDGFAVRAQDITGASEDTPVRLRVVGEARMGSAGDVDVSEGEAVVMPTGGVVPPGSDAVVPIELCDRRGDEVDVLRELPSGKHVRPAGEDVRKGDGLVGYGFRLKPADIGALASAGIDAVDVIPAARVGILSTGDELVAPGEDLADGQIYDSNRLTLAALVEDFGATPIQGRAVGDDPTALIAALDELAPNVDLFVCSGGVSMGERDPVKAAFAGGGDIQFAQVAMQPGRPQAFGAWRGRPFFGLPGNPVSVFVSFEVFVRPALLEMMGRFDERGIVMLPLYGELHAPRTRTRFARVRFEQDGVAPTGTNQSNLLVALSRADGLVEVPAGRTFGDGHWVPVIKLR